MIIALLVIILLALLVAFAGYVVFWLAFVRMEKNPLGSKTPSYMEPYMPEINEGIEWFKAQDKIALELTSFDHLRLRGNLLPARNARGTVILMHGYRSTNGYSDHSLSYRFYHELGYNVLQTFERAQDESEGKYITFGLNESKDCRDWAWLIYDRYGINHDIFLGGISMGASTVLMAAGTELPTSVRGIIADSPFADQEEQIISTIKKTIKLPGKPFLYLARLYFRLFTGLDLSKPTPLSAMTKNLAIPCFFAHGKDDRMVDFENTERLYDACKAQKTVFFSEKAGHGMSFVIDREDYSEKVIAFLNENASGGNAGMTRLTSLQKGRTIAPVPIPIPQDEEAEDEEAPVPASAEKASAEAENVPSTAEEIIEETVIPEIDLLSGVEIVPAKKEDSEGNSDTAISDKNEDFVF